MRLSMVALVAVSTMALTASASAQGTSSPSPAPLTHQDITQQHPDLYVESNTYKPCPANVVFSNGRHACLGLPEYPNFRGRYIWRRPYCWY
jgi:hypothetical protein